jgi:pseudoazurin
MTKLITRRTTLALTGAAATATLWTPAILRAQEATQHEVQMLNSHPETNTPMVFLPRVLMVQPGDSVLFTAVDRGHNSVSYDEMIPEGAEGWNGGINEEVEVTFEIPGYYGYHCVPHTSVGMVGLVIVQGEGMDANLEAAQGVRHRGRARAAWDEIWEEAEAMVSA